MNGYRCQRLCTHGIPFLLLFLLIFPMADASGVGSLNVKLTVKENAGVGATQYPVSAVVPMPRGQCSDPRMLGISEVPSQVEVLERWPGDQSLRHVLVHFQPTVSAGGNGAYHLTQGGPLAPTAPVVVLEGEDHITVTTGPLKFTVSKVAFNIIDQLWLDTDNDGLFQDREQIIQSRGRNGGVLVPRSGGGPAQVDADRNDLLMVVEERGPMRAVIRVEALTKFVSTTQHQHGFAVRIYAFAGQPLVKIDYQLQNSAKDVVRSWPLYFEALNLDFRLTLAANRNLRFGLGDGSVHRMAPGASAYLAQEMHNRFRLHNLTDGATVFDSGVLPNGKGPDGFIDVSDAERGVTALIRNFWQTWPNGLELDGSQKLSLQLFPAWSAQWQGGAFSPSGLYWLEDMQHVVKEVLMYFHGPQVSDETLIAMARTFQFYPTAQVPTDWYRQTRATLDLGGVIPPAASIPDVAEERQPFYHTEGFDIEDWYNETGPFYGAGWGNFYDPEPGYRAASCMHGGWPYSAARVIATRSPADYFEAEAHGQSELNLRPEWMAQYRHDEDWGLLQLTENPYCGGRWRIFEGHGISKLAAQTLPNTGSEEPVYFARDDQHGWFYHAMEAYFLTGDPWIRDWYQFIAEFRRVRLERLDPWPDTASRATAHSLHQVLQAYRVTGDSGLLARFREHLLTYLKPDQDPNYGDQLTAVEESGGGFQTGYLMRTMVTYLEEVRALGDRQAYAEGFNYLSGLMEWNYQYGNFPYYFDARGGGKGISSGTGLTLVDPQAWYYWNTGKKKYLDQLNLYLSQGINGGETPYGRFDDWLGQFEGRYWLYVKNTARKDATPPPPIRNLRAFMSSPTVLTLRWTAPHDAQRYHVVWSDKPIVEQPSTSKAVRNWWAAHAVGPALKPAPGKQQTVTIPVGNAAHVYAAIFTFDKNENMSAMSNAARAK
jgi:hypothetical protein